MGSPPAAYLNETSAAEREPRVGTLPMGRTTSKGMKWSLGLGLGALPFALVIAAAAQTDVRGESTVWASPAMVRLGTWSFALYLVHQLVIRAYEELFALPDHTLTGAGVLVAVLATSMALAALLHRLVEVPAERVLRGVRLRRA